MRPSLAVDNPPVLIVCSLRPVSSPALSRRPLFSVVSRRIRGNGFWRGPGPTCRVVQASDVDGVELAAEFFHVCAAEGLHAAAATEEVVYGVGAELIVRQNVPSPQQPERVGFDDSFPEPRLGADRAVAPAGALGQIELAFEADLAAVAAAVIGLFHSPSPRCPSSMGASRNSPIIEIAGCRTASTLLSEMTSTFPSVTVPSPPFGPAMKPASDVENPVSTLPTVILLSVA